MLELAILCAELRETLPNLAIHVGDLEAGEDRGNKWNVNNLCP